MVECSSDYQTAKAKGEVTDEPEFKTACRIQEIFNRISLNNIHLVIEGAMTVDVATVPATIYSVDFDGGNVPSIWTKTNTELTGAITGVYLTGGVPSAVGDNGKAIDGITVTAVAEGSSDTNLNFKMTLSKCIAPGTKVNFVVNKTPGADSTSGGSAKQTPAAAKKPASPAVPSTLFEFPQQPSAACPAAADKPAAANGPTAETPAKPAAEKAEPKAEEKTGKQPKS